MAAKRFHLLKFVHCMTINQTSPKTACFEYKKITVVNVIYLYQKLTKEIQIPSRLQGIIL